MIAREALLSSIIKIAKLAAKKILDIYQDPSAFDVTYKEDASPVTRADQISHEIITEGLSQLIMDIPIISEEGNQEFLKNAEPDSSFWLIDPLDGTKEFLERNGEFTINIALIEKREPTLGVVFAPTLDVCYYAGKSMGAYKQIGEKLPKQLSVATRSFCSDECIRVMVSRRHGLERLQAFLDKIGLHECISQGSSLKFCLIAEGKADIYPRLGETREWDTAAAQCVLEQSGGFLMDQYGKSLAYNKRGLLNPKFLALGRGDPAWSAYL